MNNLSKQALIAITAMASVLPFGVASAQPVGNADAKISAMRTSVTAIDWAIDVAVANKAKARQWSASDAGIAREQLQFQFQSLSRVKQQEVIAATQNLNSEEGVLRSMEILNQAVQSAAREALATVQAARAPASQRTQQKLGPTDTDLVFVATAGPCRVADTRNGINSVWPGPIAGGAARQIYAYSSFAGYNWGSEQGGTGIAGSGNCAGDVFATSPVEVVATLAVTNTSAFGTLRAWDGTPALTVGAVLNWLPGQVLANTTVIPLNRFGSEYPGSGPFKRDFGVFNNSSAPIDVVVDVVGYFVHNTATPLDCQTVTGSLTALGAGTSALIAAPSCPAGYTAIVGQPSTFIFGIYTGSLGPSVCRINNTTGASQSVACDAFCCRIPGL